MRGVHVAAAMGWAASLAIAGRVGWCLAVRSAAAACARAERQLRRAELVAASDALLFDAEDLRIRADIALWELDLEEERP